MNNSKAFENNKVFENSKGFLKRVTLEKLERSNNFSQVVVQSDARKSGDSLDSFT